MATIALGRAWSEGDLFALCREKARAWVGLTGRKKPLDLLGRLLRCQICLAFHLAAVLAVICLLVPLWLPDPWAEVGRVTLRTLASVTLAHFYWDWRAWFYNTPRNHEHQYETTDRA
jgi:hypothetical protein